MIGSGSPTADTAGVRVRFCEPIADDLRAELGEFARRRGTASERAAERIVPIELVIDDPAGEHERITGRLRPPSRHDVLRLDSRACGLLSMDVRSGRAREG
jgi:hypothetical protein